jgi:hypothetical protein
MSRTLQSAILTGRARVKLRDGSTLAGWASYDGKVITLEGHLRVVSMVDGESVATYRPLGRRTMPLRAIDHIVWETDPEQA